MDLLISQRESESMKSSEAVFKRRNQVEEHHLCCDKIGFDLQAQIESMFASCMILRGEDLAHSWTSSTELFKNGVMREQCEE
jgi:hypothetical protein